MTIISWGTSNKLNQLVNDVEELLDALSDEQSSEVKALRDQVQKAIESTKSAISAQGTSAIGNYADSMDNKYITQNPRLAFSTGALIGGVLGYLAGLTRSIRANLSRASSLSGGV